MASDPPPVRGPRLGGIGLSGAIPFVTTPGARPLAEAILYRVFKEVLVDLKSESFAAAERHADQLLPGFFDPLLEMTIEDWLKSYKNSRRRKQLVRALQKYVDRGCHAKDWLVIKAFVKKELLPYFRGTPAGPATESVSYIARLIQAPHDETHLVAGPYLKPLTHRLKEVWHHENWIFYASVTPDKLDSWINNHRYAKSWFWSDYSAFDATYSHLAWDMLEGFYKRIYPQAPLEFWQVLKAWRRPYGKVHLRREERWVEYQSDVCNASGRDDTALANALLNGLALSLSLTAAWLNKPIAQLTEWDLSLASRVFAIAVVGDDSLVACKVDVEPYRSSVADNIASFGLSAKIEISQNLHDVTFLGMMPYPVEGRLWWGPTIGRRAYKAFWQCDPIGNLPAWTKGVAEQLALYQCVPVLSDMANRVLELLPKASITRQTPDENRVWAARDSRTPRWTQETLMWLCQRYDRLTPALVERDVATLKQIVRLPCVVYLHTTFEAVSVDDL